MPQGKALAELTALSRAIREADVFSPEFPCLHARADELFQQIVMRPILTRVDAAAVCQALLVYGTTYQPHTRRALRVLLRFLT